TGEQVEQCRLAGAVRPDQPDAVAALDARGKIAHDGALAVALDDVRRLDHQLAGKARVLHGHSDAAGRAVGARLLPRTAHRPEAGEPALIALSPRGHAIAQPVLLAHDPAVELVLLALLLLEQLVAPRLEGGEALL